MTPCLRGDTCPKASFLLYLCQKLGDGKLILCLKNLFSALNSSWWPSNRIFHIGRMWANLNLGGLRKSMGFTSRYLGREKFSMIQKGRYTFTTWSRWASRTCIFLVVKKTNSMVFSGCGSTPSLHGHELKDTNLKWSKPNYWNKSWEPNPPSTWYLVKPNHFVPNVWNSCFPWKTPLPFRCLKLTLNTSENRPKLTNTWEVSCRWRVLGEMIPFDEYVSNGLKP